MKRNAEQSKSDQRGFRKPVHIARCGNVVVRVARNGKATYLVAWREFAGAPRRRQTFSVRKAAIERADEIARTLANGQAESVKLTGADRESYRRAIITLRPFGLPLHVFAEQYAAARAALPDGYTVQEACERLAADVAAAVMSCPPAAQVAAELVDHLRTDPHRQRDPRDIGRFKARALAVAEAFPNLATITPEGADRFLRGLGVAAKTRDHYLAAAKALVAYAQRRGWLPAGDHGFSAVKKVFRPGPVETFSVEEMREILAACQPKWIPFVALGAFAGLRTAEISRLTWDAVRWQENEIALDMRITKTGHPRNVPLEPNLRAWLLPHARRVGRIYNYASARGFEKATQALHRELEERIEGFHWRDNGLRHSYGSYLYGRERNLPLVRAYMGNSEAMVMRFYNSPKTREQGVAWFTIAPASGLVPISATV